MSAKTLTARILTPEDVVLNLKVAPWHARLVAFVLDAAVMIACLVFVMLAVDAIWPSDEWLDVAESLERQQLATTLRNFMVFVITKFYFIFFEIKWSGQTLGKRLTGLRVTTQDGSPLETGSVVARNLTRDLETIFPIVAILSPSSLGLEGGVQIALFWFWLIAVSCIPFFNTHHYRLGDLIAKTMVIRLPRTELLADLSAPSDTDSAERADAAGPFEFTSAQLSHYGAEELHVLEGVLRFHDDDQSPGGALVTNVAARIATRTGWTADNPTESSRINEHGAAHAFLTAFYRAQRAHLEALLRHKGTSR